MIGTYVSDRMLAGKADSRPAVILADAELTYGELHGLVGRFEERLRSAGAGPGSRVALQIAPSVTYVAALLSALRMGCQVLLLDHRLTVEERDRCLSAVPPDVVATAAADGALTDFQLTRAVEVRPTERSGTPSEAGIVQFSSGSTGQPKVVARYGASMVAELERFASVDDWVQADDVALVLNSLVHSFGVFGGLLHSLQAGATLAFAAGSRPGELAAAVRAFRPTVITGVPAHFDLLAAGKSACDSVRACVSGGQSLSAGTAERFDERCASQIGQAYGLTETGIVAMDVGGIFGHDRAPVLDGLDVAVVDDEIVVAVEASPYLAGGDEGRVRDGWLHTGDLGSLWNGVLQIRGRTDSVIAIGGLKVDLGDVEACLRAADGADDVVVLCVGGVVQAWVESSRPVTAAALHDWCATRLAPYKRPRRITVLPVLPRTASGKVLRRPELLDAGRA